MAKGIFSLGKKETYKCKKCKKKHSKESDIGFKHLRYGVKGEKNGKV